MNRRTFLGTTLAAGMVGIVVGIEPAATSQGQDMRIETEVYSGRSKQPVFENITLFTGNFVYDFSRTGPERITVYDRSRGKFVLLDVADETKVVLDQPTVDGYVDLLKTREKLASREPFLFDPTFDETFDSAKEELTLSSEEMTYRIVGMKSKSPELLEAYIEFANWYSKLSATDPRQMPPFARLKVNQALADHQLIPKEVERVYRPRNNVFATSIQAKTKHYVVWQLSRKDRQRIDEAMDYVTRFEEIPLAEFYGLESSEVAAPK